MRKPRIYHPEPLSANAEIALSEDAANHVGRVLRMSAGQALQLFDGSNQVFEAEITRVDKKNVLVQINAGQLEDRESPLNLHLGQVISRGEKMEFTIQKSIELGVNVITPLFSERCGVKLDGERLEKNSNSGKKSPSRPASNAAATAFRKSAQQCLWNTGAPSRTIASS